jgi:phage terminase large subunit-like protein
MPFNIQLIDVNRTSKVSRVYSIEHMFSSGMIYAPDKIFADAVISQVSMFPVGKRNDLVDSMSMAIRWLRDNRFAITQVEEQMEDRTRSRFQWKMLPLYPA